MTDKPQKLGWFQRIKKGLSKSSEKLTTGISSIFTRGKKIDVSTLEELEDLLIQADLGLSVTTELINDIEKRRFKQDITSEEVQRLLCESIYERVKNFARPFLLDSIPKPQVIMMLGVNGVGKTTCTAKLAHSLKTQGHHVALGACDTFRAGAIEQLDVWADRLNCPLFKNLKTKDAAAVAHEAYAEAKRLNYDALILDTAGRLHTKSHLMDEMVKIQRVIQKADPAAPHHVLLSVDATSGQNVLTQIQEFNTKIPVTGLIMTKLDGTSKGGILVQAAEKFKLPIYYIGVGESLEALQEFDAKAFSRSLVGASEDTIL